MTIGRRELALRAAENTGLNPTKARLIVDQILVEISDRLFAGEKVKLSNFGSFIVRTSPERLGRNPKTLEPAVISARVVIAFQSAAYMKKRCIRASN